MKRALLISIVMKYELLFLLIYYTLLGGSSLLFNMDFTRSLLILGDARGTVIAGVIVFPIIAGSFGAIGLGAASIHAEAGPIPFTELVLISLSGGPFQRVLKPCRETGTIFFVMLFLPSYMVLWFITTFNIEKEIFQQWIQAIGYGVIAIAIIIPIVASLITSILLLPRMTPEQLAREMRGIRK